LFLCHLNQLQAVCISYDQGLSSQCLYHSSLKTPLDFLTIASPPSWMNSLEVIGQLF
jgi:hypothetical protein